VRSSHRLEIKKPVSCTKSLIILTTCGAVGPTYAQHDNLDRETLTNWHQWRGPLACGVAPEGDPPVEWSEQKNVPWKTPLPGDGSSSPIVWRDRVFVTTAVRTNRTVDALPPLTTEPPGGYKTERPRDYYRFTVLCIDRNNGRVLWDRTATEEVPHEGHQPTHGYASASPTTDGKRLYVSFGSRGIFGYDLDGNLLWKRDLGDMLTRFGWGEGTSPVIHGDSLVVNWDHEGDSALYVLDAPTGATRWKVDRNEVTSWSTPLVVERGSKTQVIVNATRRVTSYDLATGTILWECGGQTVNCIPSPVAAEGIVYCMSGYQGSALYAIPIDSTGDLTDSDKMAWKHRGGTPYVPSPLLVGGLLYFTAGNNPILSCLDARSGKAVIEATRLPKLTSIYASPVYASGRAYFVGRDGATVVLQHGPEYKVLSVNSLADPMDASPAIVGKQMFLRGHGHLYCVAQAQ
jgi:outer membrane protein assembly factor BamB